jgi:hypothetical protein
MIFRYTIFTLLLLFGLAHQSDAPDFKAPEITLVEFGFDEQGTAGRIRAAGESGNLSPMSLFVLSGKGDISPEVIIFIFETPRGAYSTIWGKRRIAQVIKSQCIDELPTFDKEYWTAKVENGKIKFQPLDNYKSIKSLFSNVAAARQRWTMAVNSPMPQSTSRPWERDVARFLNESPRDQWFKDGLLQPRLLACVNFSATITKAK